MTYVPTRKEIQDHVVRRTDEIRIFSNNHFDINIKPFRVKTTFKNTKRLGLGGLDKFGNPLIRLNLHCLETYPVCAWIDYRSLQRVRGIESFATTNWKDWLDALILHEFAHVIQFVLPRSQSSLRSGNNFNLYDSLGRFDNGHGDFFIRILRVLRENFLNNRIELVYPSDYFKAFDMPEEVTERVPVISEFHGQKVRLGEGMFEVVDYLAKNRKYPIIVSNGTKRYRISLAQLQQFRVFD